ncbi:MAG TPA: DUF1707 domain-containing protein [Streptosporangiaceae bacterium]|nr:DUF1707 domain-containing protein [Streptosporangiaceae bacterium]
MTNLPEGIDPRDLRASDHDRDRVAEVLRHAAGDGRLTLDELEERLSAVYAAKTYGDLEPITRDLPIGAPPAAAPATAPDAPFAGRIGGRPTSSIAIGIMGGFTRRGGWTVPPVFTAVAFWGGGEIDLREARFAEREVTIRVFAVMGGVNVIVPEHTEVVVRGIGIMGGFDDRASGAGEAGAPRIVVTGVAFWGGVGVVRKPTRGELRRRKQELREERRRLERGDDA